MGWHLIQNKENYMKKKDLILAGAVLLLAGILALAQMCIRDRDAAFLNRAKGVIDRIIASQSVDVDTCLLYTSTGR